VLHHPKPYIIPSTVAPLPASLAFHTGLRSRSWTLHINQNELYPSNHHPHGYMATVKFNLSLAMITIIDEYTFVNTFEKNFHFPFIDLFLIFTTFGCFMFNVESWVKFVKLVMQASSFQHFQQQHEIYLIVYIIFHFIKNCC